jgi:hypothetical protein
MSATLILLLSLVGTDVRYGQRVEVPRSIERTLLRVGAGLIASGGNEERAARFLEWFESGAIEVKRPRIYLEGRRTGRPAGRVLGAIWRVGAFLAGRGAGRTVELRYTIRYRGWVADRSVWLTRGEIRSTIGLACRMGPDDRVRGITAGYTAREGRNGTTIDVRATVRAFTGICPERERSRCRVVNRVAAGMARRELGAAIAGAVDEVEAISAAGHDALIGFAGRCLGRIIERLE